MAEKPIEDDLDALLEDAESAPLPMSDPVPILIGTHVIELQFRRLPALEWAKVTAMSPARPDVLIDRTYGYDFQSAALAAAEMSGIRVDVHPHHVPTAKQWERMRDRMSGHDLNNLVDTIWTLNEYAPQEAVAAAKKASLELRRTSLPSPESSESVPAASAAGSRVKRPSSSNGTSTAARRSGSPASKRSTPPQT